MSIYQSLSASRRLQVGMSLIELMIAMTIGLILMFAVGNIMIGSRQSNQVNDGLARMQENARFAMQLLKRDLRSAGLVQTAALEGLEVFGDRANALTVHAAVTVPPANTAGDVLVVQFEGTTDCTGGGGVAFSGTTLVVNRYRVDSTNSTLRCLGNGGGVGEQELLEGIERMEVQYGIDNDANGQANFYQSPGNVIATDWPNVVSIRIGLMVNSVNAINELPVNANAYYLLDSGQMGPFSDRVLRQIYITTVTMRNRMQIN